MADLGSASLSFSSLYGLGGGSRDRFIELTDAVWRVRGYGDFWSYCLVAEGAVDIAAEPEVSCGTSRRWTSWCVKPAACSPISPGAGPHGGNVVATNGLLHEAVLAHFHRA